MFLISGITGHVGGAAAGALLSSGHKVRAIVRQKSSASAWDERGVQLIEGDMNDSEVVSRALQNVQGAFLMMFPIQAPDADHRAAKLTLTSYEEALKRSPPPKLILLSSVGSEKTSGLGNITQTHLMEEAISNQSFPVGIVRAGSFLENYAYAVKQAEFTGSFDIFLSPTDRKVPMIATEDIGKQIATLLSEKWSGKRIIELGSRISPEDLAVAVSEVIGKKVTVRSIPRQQWSACLEQMGLPNGQTGQYEEMLDGFNSGWIDFGLSGTEPVAGSVSATEVLKKALA